MLKQKKLPKRYQRKRWDFLTQDKEGVLYIEDLSVKDITKKYGTPLYVMLESKIRKKAREFLEAFPYPKVKIQYASKVNTNLEILRIMREEGLELDASSVGEIILGLLADFRPDQITFTNLYKSEQDICFAAQIGVQAITADSIEELLRIGYVGEKLRKTINVFLRFNPLIDYGKYTTRNQQYGITPDLAKKAINIALRSYYINLVGFHFHGSYITDPKIYSIAARRLLKYAKYCNEKGNPITHLDLGGGFPNECNDDKKYFSPKEMGPDFIKELVETLKEFDLPYPTLIFEPGKSLVMNAGVGLVEVISNKWHANRQTIMTDGSTYGFVPDVLIYKENYDILPATQMNKPRVNHVRICGCTCDCIDIIDKHCHMPNLDPGDILSIMDIGAYSSVMASNFNTVRRAAMILLKEDGTTKLIRRRDRYSEMFAPELDVLKLADPKELKNFYDIYRVNINKIWQDLAPKNEDEQNRKKRKKYEEQMNDMFD
ncbi:MAG: hypothetical protein WC755_05905 [Candidatus Woesearchaeota archaeon]|jgi:diaminopimelate decarboxylase